MKKIFLYALLCAGVQAFGQTNISLPQEYGLAGLASHPAGFQISNETGWSANVLSVNVWTSSNTASLSLSHILAREDFLRKNVLGFSDVSSGYAGFDVRGPALGMRIGQGTSIAMSTRGRAFVNFSDLNGRLISEIGEKVKVRHEYPYEIELADDMLVNTSVLTDVSLTISQILLETDKHQLRGGLSVKYINGVANSSLEVSGLTGVINTKKVNKKNVSYLSNAFGQVNTRTAGNLLADFSLKNFFQPRKGTFGADFGLSYEYFENPGGPARFSLMVSLTDLGNVRYRADSTYSKSYDIGISSDDGLNFNNNFDNSFSTTTEVFEKYPEFFSQTSVATESYKVSLPSMLRFKLNYMFKGGFNTMADLAMNVRKTDIIKRAENIAYVSIAPGWSKKHIGISLPVSLQKFSGFNAGGSFRYKGFFIGSNSILSAMIASRQIDGYIGLLLNP
ncbi:hypothetical protein [Dyadobacter bucti]|uniref:hypothetical protein n=1 Tax=Dyadobacter bucti TaxID=2572203 RepID=UPI003F7055BF